MGNHRVVSVEKLVRAYGTYTAVNGISFQVDCGEVFGLLGTNGAGKTSTLEVLEGIAEPNGGEVAVFGRHPLAVRSEMGIMLQSGGLPQNLTVWQTMQMWQGTCSKPRDIMDVLVEVGLHHREKVKVGALSGGEQRRLDLACALLGNPTLLFLDEPTTGLDPESRRNVWELLLKLKQRGVTIVLTTHYLEEAEFLCDRIAIMHAGRLAVVGTVTDIIDSAVAEISFAAVDPLLLPEFFRNKVVVDRDRSTISTKELQNDTRKLLQWAHTQGVTLRNFMAKPASLEQVFLNIAGSDM